MLVYIVFCTVLINIPGIMTNNLPKIIYGTAWFVLSHMSVYTDCTLNLIWKLKEERSNEGFSGNCCTPRI